MNLANFEGIRAAARPHTAIELCECIHCIAYMSTANARLAEISALLHKVLEEAYRLSGRSTNKSVAKFSVADLCWNTAHVDAFNGLRSQLQKVVKTAHRDPSLRMCVQSDAGKAFWATVVTQCADEDLRKRVVEQKHEPLLFLSCHFNNRQKHWTTFENEA